MSLQQLQSFVAVAETGGITQAARRLHLSQPPLTRQIRRLEDELGQVLFERMPRGTRLTDAGARFLPYARTALAAVEAAEKAFEPA